ncbi:MAG TPA: PQQ-binding-like beta-propeller repeat protein [Acidobacteriaceae bacterium]|nr:PQQ-binding-like beta-propeller repeat protein [Acidobacteriaceae bacterium]
MTTSNPTIPLTVALSGTGVGGNLPISPASATVSEGATQQFNANPNGFWSASCGSVTQGGLYTAPLNIGTCTVTVTPLLGSPASATVTVTSPITLTPAGINLHALNAQQFTASAPVTWADTCNAISASGLFTAPTSPSTCTLTATASTGTAYTAVATVNVDVVNYTSWRNGPGNAGVQSDELVLTPSNVNTTSFGLKWQANVDGWVNAQPLYMNALMINGVAHNVVFFATENDSVYAFDADSGAQLWQVSLIPQGATAVASSSIGYSSTQAQWGILGTPVIDPTTNTMYVVAETSEQNATYFPHRLHALDITTGQEKFGGPVLISNAQMAPVKKLQRPGLLLANGSIYVGIGSMQDSPPYNGLLFQFSASNLSQQNVWVDTPSGNEGGIWSGGAAPSADANGNIFLSTGNGTFDGISNFGQSAVRFNPNLQMVDYFAPYDYASDNAADRDLGSSGALVLPDQNGPYPHELITCGKKPMVYLVNRDNMGHVGTSSDNVIQEFSGQVGNPAPGSTNTMACLSEPGMLGQNVYFGGNYDALKIFTLNPATGLLSTTPTVTGNFVFGSKGADFMISSNGLTNGIVWAIDTHTGDLVASDATTLQTLYASRLGGGVFAWAMPTVVNGHVYVGEEGIVFAYGPK